MKIEIRVLNKEFYQDVVGVDFDAKQARVEYKNLPAYATEGSAGLDLRATHDVVVSPGETCEIYTGLAIHIGSLCSEKHPSRSDMGYMGMVVPRSGLGSKGLILANTIGVIDEDYQGELIINAWNRNDDYMAVGHQTIVDRLCIPQWFNNESEKIEIKAGDRIAQLIFVPIIKAQFNIVDEFTVQTTRGTNGWGSTD